MEAAVEGHRSRCLLHRRSCHRRMNTARRLRRRRTSCGSGSQGRRMSTVPSHRPSKDRHSSYCGSRSRTWVPRRTCRCSSACLPGHSRHCQRTHRLRSRQRKSDRPSHSLSCQFVRSRCTQQLRHRNDRQDKQPLPTQYTLGRHHHHHHHLPGHSHLLHYRNGLHTRQSVFGILDRSS